MNQKGLTLIEMMIAIVIISVMSVVVVTQYSNSRNLKTLSFGVEQIAGDVRAAQNYALGALETGGKNPGYGVSFSKDSDSYIIFADKDNSKTYNNGGEEFQTVKLPEGVTVQGLKVDAEEKNLVDVVFTCPYGKTYINEADKNGVNFVVLKVRIENSAGERTIDISSSGKIK